MATTAPENAYRAERKERLAKNAKKKNQKSHDSVFVVTIIAWVVGIALILAMVCGILWAYGVPQSMITAETINGRKYSMADFSYYYMTAFQNAANEAYSNQQSYGFNLSGFNYQVSPSEQTTTDSDGNTITFAEKFRQDAVKALEELNYYLDLAEKEGMTLSEENEKKLDDEMAELASQAESSGLHIDRYCSESYGKGVTLKKVRGYYRDALLVEQYLQNQQDAISASITDEQIDEEYEKNPTSYQQVDIRLFGLSIEADETAVEETETSAPAEETTAAEETAAAETTAPAEETGTTAAAAAEEATTAAPAAEEETAATPSAQEVLVREMLGRITDEQSFIDLAKEYCKEEDKTTYEEDTATLLKGVVKSAVSSNIDADFAEWLFDTERKAGDKDVVVTDSMAYVVYVVNPAYRNEQPLVTVRHILSSYASVAADLNEEKDAADLQIETKTASDGTEITNEGTGYSIDVAIQTYEKALRILNDYNSGEQSEDAFAALADENSDDTASIGDSDNGGGGLYENVQQGQMVTEFDEWIYDDSRTAGEVGLVKTTYGWHIIYFVSKQEEPAYKTTIRNALVSAKAEEESKKTADQITNLAVSNKTVEDMVVKSSVKMIEQRYVTGE